MASGNQDIILCERGIRTFETYTRNTLDLACIPVLRKLSHLPIIIDPSHATGKSWLVDPLAVGAVATGADGLLIEVHNDPAHGALRGCCRRQERTGTAHLQPCPGTRDSGKDGGKSRR